MAGADVVLVNGLHFEGFLQRLVEASATKATVVELTKGVEPLADDGRSTSMKARLSAAEESTKRTATITARSTRTPSSRSPMRRST